MYPSLAAAKAAVIAVGEEIATQGLPLGVSPIVFVFVGTGNGIIFLPVLILIFVHPFDQASNSNAADYISWTYSTDFVLGASLRAEKRRYTCLHTNKHTGPHFCINIA